MSVYYKFVYTLQPIRLSIHKDHGIRLIKTQYQENTTDWQMVVFSKPHWSFRYQYKVTNPGANAFAPLQFIQKAFIIVFNNLCEN